MFFPLIESGPISPRYRLAFFLSGLYLTLLVITLYGCKDASQTVSGLVITVGSVDMTSGRVTGTLIVFGKGEIPVPPTLPGVVDKSFGTNGVATFETTAEIEARAAAVQNGGRLLVAGDRVNEESGVSEAIIVAFTESGVGDSSFGNDGLVAFDDPAKEIRAVDLVVQADGKIIFLLNAGDTLIAVTRYTFDGMVDPTFGDEGLVVLGTDTIAFWAGAAAMQQNQEIVLVATAKDLQDPTIPSLFAGFRLDEKGHRDDGFDLFWGPGADLVANAVNIQTDGKVVVVGSSVTPGYLGYAQYRGLSDGSPDPGFESGVLYDKKNPQITFKGKAVALQGDGKILISGDAADASNDEKSLFVARQLENGVTDDPFGTLPWQTGGLGAILVRPEGRDSFSRAIAVQRDQKILVLGTSTDRVTEREVAFISRLNIYGVFDILFGKEGIYQLSDPSLDITAADLVLQDNGMAVAAATGTDAATDRHAFILSRVLTGGLQSFTVQNNDDNPVFAQVSVDGTWTAELSRIEPGLLNLRAVYEGETVERWVSVPLQ